MNRVAGEDYGIEMPKTGAHVLKSLLDAHGSSELDGPSLLVLNCNEDYNTESENGATCRNKPTQPAFRTATRTDAWIFVGVNSAGHGIPGYLLEASYRILQRWIANQWR
ncbi:hypothetical protein HC256_009417 [Beauveria bassiana]|nr:hypothetical protein HC256_009417 [Beauveria bassiana]